MKTPLNFTVISEADDDYIFFLDTSLMDSILVPHKMDVGISIDDIENYEALMYVHDDKVYNGYTMKICGSLKQAFDYVMEHDPGFIIVNGEFLDVEAGEDIDDELFDIDPYASVN